MHKVKLEQKLESPARHTKNKKIEAIPAKKGILPKTDSSC